jgi:hypothetical protein
MTHHSTKKVDSAVGDLLTRIQCRTPSCISSSQSCASSDHWLCSGLLRFALFLSNDVQLSRISLGTHTHHCCSLLLRTLHFTSDLLFTRSIPHNLFRGLYTRLNGCAPVVSTRTLRVLIGHFRFRRCYSRIHDAAHRNVHVVRCVRRHGAVVSERHRVASYVVGRMARLTPIRSSAQC